MTQRGFLTLDSAPWLIAAVCAVTTVLFFNLYNGVTNEYSKFRADVEAVQEQVRLDNERKLEAMEQVAGKATEDWQSALRELDRRGRIVRVQPHRCPGEMPGLSTTPTVVEGLQAGSGESWITTTQCEQIANDSTLDREWIETVKQLTDDLHEASK